MQTVEILKNRAAEVLNRHDVAEAYLFGSVARGEAREDSDVDILVRFNKLNGLFEFVKVKMDIEEALGGRPVDLVQMEALKPEYREMIEKQRIRIV